MISFGRSLGAGASSISKVTLIRPGSTTHSNDMDQRYVPYCPSPCTTGDGSPEFIDQTGTITLSGTPDTKAAPPGYYMLFLVNNLGRPSVGLFVNLWEIPQSTVSHNLVINPGNTFTLTVTWKTSAKAVEGDELVLAGNPIPVTGTPSDPAGLVHSLSYTGECVPEQTWSYVVKSKRPKYTVGDAASVSVSTPKTFKPTACLE